LTSQSRERVISPSRIALRRDDLPAPVAEICVKAAPCVSLQREHTSTYGDQGGWSALTFQARDLTQPHVRPHLASKFELPNVVFEGLHHTQTFIEGLLWSILDLLHRRVCIVERCGWLDGALRLHVAQGYTSGTVAMGLVCNRIGSEHGTGLHKGHTDQLRQYRRDSENGTRLDRLWFDNAAPVSGEVGGGLPRGGRAKRRDMVVNGFWFDARHVLGLLTRQESSDAYIRVSVAERRWTRRIESSLCSPRYFPCGSSLNAWAARW
jgi:hypothetical protein